MTSVTTFGCRLARLRRERGLSQRQLADRLCQLAGAATVSRNEISRWERGVRLPAQAWLGWLAVALGTPLVPPAPRAQRDGDETIRRRWRALRPRISVRSAVRLGSTHGASG
jgi:transcriptional regulator with XRE-family HTH domain